LGNLTYHPAIDLAEPNISLIQSPPCHIPSMNMGLKKKNQGFPEIEPPPP